MEQIKRMAVGDWVGFIRLLIVVGGVVWGFSFNIFNKLHEMELAITQGFGEVRSEIVQYHTMRGTQQKQIDKIENLVETHQRDQKIHKMWE